MLIYTYIYADMVITFERVWPVGRFDVERSATTTTTWSSRQPAVFLSQSGAIQSETCQKGAKPCQKGELLRLRRDGGYTLARAFQKGILGRTPLLITFVHPLSRYTLEKKPKKNLDGSEEPRKHDK